MSVELLEDAASALGALLDEVAFLARRALSYGSRPGGRAALG